MATIKEIAAKAFTDNPNAKKVFVTSDGFPFLTENAANLHATSNANKKNLQVTEFARNAEETPKPNSDKTDNESTELSNFAKAKLRVDAISKLETIEEVDKALETETAGTVKKAGETRKKELALLSKSGTLDPATRGAEITEGDVKKSVSDNEDANINPTKEEE